jgi:CRP-like cAMP-binding protein
MDDALPAWLSTLALFEHVSRETIAEFARSALCRELRPGETLFEEGEPGQFMFVVERGALDALARSGAPDARGPARERDHELVLRTLGRGDWGGLTSIMLDKPRSATLRAAGPC